jgi:hypothetical protein
MTDVLHVRFLQAGINIEGEADQQSRILHCGGQYLDFQGGDDQLHMRWARASYRLSPRWAVSLPISRSNRART